MSAKYYDIGYDEVIHQEIVDDERVVFIERYGKKLSPQRMSGYDFLDEVDEIKAPYMYFRNYDCLLAAFNVFFSSCDTIDNITIRSNEPTFSEIVDKILEDNPIFPANYRIAAAFYAEILFRQPANFTEKVCWLYSMINHVSKTTDLATGCLISHFRESSHPLKSCALNGLLLMNSNDYRIGGLDYGKLIMTGGHDIILETLIRIREPLNEMEEQAWSRLLTGKPGETYGLSLDDPLPSSRIVPYMLVG